MSFSTSPPSPPPPSSDEIEPPLGQEIIGVVMNYDRVKCYGHIKPHNAPPGARDIFVHRSGIASDLPAAQFPSNPFLRQGEKVKFVVEKTEKGYRAEQVAFLKRNIPPLRISFLSGRMLRAKEVAARFLFQKLEETDLNALTDQDKINLLDGFSETYNREIENAVRVIEKVGMDISTFPKDLSSLERKNGGAGRKPDDTTQPRAQAQEVQETDPLESLMKSLDESKQE